MFALFVVLLTAGFSPCVGAAPTEEPVLTLSIGTEVRRFTAAQLLGRPDAVELTIPADVSYGRPMKYRAVPLLPLVSVGTGIRYDRSTCCGRVRLTNPACARGERRGGWRQSLDRHRGPGRSVARSSGQDHKRRPVLSGVGEPGTLCYRERAVALSARLPHGSRVSGAPLAADGGRCEPARGARQRGAVRQFSRPSACPAIA